MTMTGTVSDLMIPLADYPHVRGDASLRDVYAKLHAVCGSAELFRSVLVLDENDRLLGMLGLKDLLHALLPDYLRRSTSQYQGKHQDVSALASLWEEDCAEQCRMARKIIARDHVTPLPAAVEPGEPLSKVVFLFATTPVNILPVVIANRLTGVLRLVDVLDAVTTEVLSEVGHE